MNIGRKHSALLLLLAIYLAVTLSYGLLNPLGEAPDETAHMELIRFIGEQGHLPRNEADRQAAGYKSDGPMLYHILVGAATSWVNYDELPHLKASDLSPRRILINDGLSPFAVIHTDDEIPPYQGVVLAWRLARLASALFSLGTLVVVYTIVLTIRPGDFWLALGTTAIVAAVPRFHFMASVVNDDNLLGLLIALFTLGLVKAWQHPEGRWVYAGLGVWMGLAVTTKYSVILLPILVVVVLAYAVQRSELDWRTALSRLFLFGATAAVTTSWWFIYIEWYFNRIEELGLASGLVSPLYFDQSTQRVSAFLTGQAGEAGATIQTRATLWDWATTIFHTFWFAPGEADTTVVTALSLLLIGLCGLTLTGLWLAWRRRYDLPWPILGLLALQIALLLPLPLLRFYLTFNVAETGQGRHILLPAAAAVGLLLIFGASAWFPSNRRYLAGPALLAGALLLISLVTFGGFVLPGFPARLPVRTSADAAKNVPDPVNILFGEGIKLISYQVGEVNDYGALPVSLIWNSQAYVDQDYLVELSLLDSGGQVRSRSLNHPVDGRYPTRAWQPGDVVSDTGWLLLAGQEAGSYQLQLRLLPLDNINLASATESGVLLDNVVIPNSRLQPATHTLELPNGLSAGFDVWQAGEPTSGMPIYKFRAAIPITFSQSQAKVSLVSTDDVEQTPVAQAGNTYLFLADAFWPSDEYRLRAQSGGDKIESEPILRAQVRPRNFDVPPMSTEVRANFGDEMMLLGYDFPKRRTQPGGALPITLYWQALGPMQHHYIVSNHLLSNAELRQWGGNDRVPQGYYSTTLWTPGEVVEDEYLVPIDPSAPPGVYRLDVGLYAELAGQSWPVPRVQDGTTLDTNTVTIGPIKVGGPPPGVTVDNPSPQYPHSNNLADLVTFLGYDLSLAPETLNLTLYWRCDAPLAADYTTFVHVRDSMSGTILAQADRPPADGAYPTSLWDTGEIIRDSIQIPIPPQALTGEYEVIVGLYDFANGQRLPVVHDQDVPVGDHIRLGGEINLR
jgi:hypothetical protein